MIRLVSVGNLEAAVTLLLSTPPEGSHFHANALRAVALSSAVSRSLHELAVKVNMEVPVWNFVVIIYLFSPEVGVTIFLILYNLLGCCSQPG